MRLDARCDRRAQKSPAAHKKVPRSPARATVLPIAAYRGSLSLPKKLRPALRSWAVGKMNSPSAFRVMRDPVLCDGCPIAQPDAFVTLHVFEQPRQRADPAGAPDDTAVQTDAHHARGSFGSHAVEPVKRIPAVGEEVIAGAEIAAAL